MITKPLHERRSRKSVSFVLGVRRDGTLLFASDAECEWITLNQLRSYDGVVYLFERPTEVVRRTDARQWTGYSWSGALNKLVLSDGPTCYPWHSVVKNLPTDEAIDESVALFTWLEGKAVLPGSLSSMTWRLWRSTLDVPVDLSSLPSHQSLGMKALYGGRQEAPYPGDYTACRHYDITSAYPTAMASRPYPTTFVDAGKTIGEESGIARVAITIPRMEWAPIPVRIRRHILCYGYGKAIGYWTWNDLRIAKDVGCEIDVKQSWAGDDYVELFTEWWPVLLEGRRRTPLAKAVTSRLWGAFSLSQTGGTMIQWLDAEGTQAIMQPMAQRQKRLPSAPYIAAETTARVRSRLYREAISGCRDLLYVDTDGIITGGELPPDKIGPLPGQWRVKNSMVRCEIRGPQVLRHECATCNRDHAKWHYVVAGAVSVEHAIRIFEHTGRHIGDGAAVISPNTITLPRGRLENYRDLSTVNVHLRRKV